MPITLTVKASIEIPDVPDKFRMTDGQMLPVSAVTDEGLKQIGARWLEALRENARAQIKQNENREKAKSI